MDTVALASVVSSGLVGFTGIAFGFSKEWTSRAYEREKADLAELRAVLDDASARLTKAETAARDAWVNPGEPKGGVRDQAMFSRLMATDSARERIRIRLGDENAVTKNFAAAVTSRQCRHHGRLHGLGGAVTVKVPFIV